jgi:hypothetical protein
MFFNVLAKVVERQLPQFVQMMQSAKIFRSETHGTTRALGEATGLAEAAGEVLSGWSPDERTIENFRLPFPTIVIEEADSRTDQSWETCLLATLDASGRQYAFLMGKSGQSCPWVSSGIVTAFPGAESIEEGRQIGRIESMTNWRCNKGSVEVVPCPSYWYDTDPCNITSLTLSDEHTAEKMILSMEISKRDGVNRLFTTLVSLRVLASLVYVALINEPSRFIVEERPLHPVNEPKTVIRRTTGRPHFIILTPQEIRRRYIWPGNSPETGEDDGVSGKVSGHERRGHFRRLQSERYVKCRGQVLWIEPCWVGLTEGVVCNNKYKVRLDL